MSPRKSLVFLLVLALLSSVSYALGRWSRVVRAADAKPTRLSASGHTHAPPATRGSDLYQYAYPAGGRGQESVYPAEAPAPDYTRKVKEFELVVEETIEHEIAPGVKAPAWTFNRTVPGPVLRVTEGDRVRITLVNKGSLPHTIHFHGIHPAEMDGVFELVGPGMSFTYEFIARPFGVFPYHCHSMPSSQHILNGLYGMMIVDPPAPRAKMRELAMVMSAFDLDRDGEADFYAWNGRAFQYADHPVDLKVGEPVRMYVLNIFEEMMAPHIHGNVFGLNRSGTALKPAEVTDVVALGIAERAILEFTYNHPGLYMFQCHFSEHMEQGLMGWFRVAEKTGAVAQQPPARGHKHGPS